MPPSISEAPSFAFALAPSTRTSAWAEMLPNDAFATPLAPCPSAFASIPIPTVDELFPSFRPPAP